MKCAKNESRTLSADIKELIATYVMNIGNFILYTFPLRNDFERTKKINNTKKGRKCFVFANGPSMNLVDIDKIKKCQMSGFDVIGINNQIVSEMANTIIPNYYVLSDPITFGMNDETTPFSARITAEKVITKLNKLNIPVFIPAHFSNLELFNEYYIFNDFGNRFSRNINITKPRGYIELTGYKAIAIACHLGYQEIYICGFDNDYFKTISVDEDNNIYHMDRHYYDDGVKCIAPCNSGKGLGNLLWDHHRRFKDFELFSRHNIINLDKNGLVDVFTKKHDLDVYKK